MSSLLLLAALATGPARAETADRVFVFVFDGVRPTEAVMANSEGPAWLKDLMALGVTLPDLRNRDATTTEPAHRTMFTGRRQPVSNYPWYEGRDLQRAISPTLFEEVAAQLGEETWIVGNTVFMDSQGTSLYPEHPGRWWPEEATTEDLSRVDDEALMLELQAAVDELDPALVLVNLHEADKEAHANRWEGYRDGTRQAVALVKAFAAANGRDGDAFIALADHGRHLDDVGFAQHGDGCAGCRSSWLIAWGAGVTDASSISASYELADVAPTIAALMGIDAPMAHGRVISELLADPPAAPLPADVLLDPVVASDDGVLHLVATSRARDIGDRLLYARSIDGGSSWSIDWFGGGDDASGGPLDLGGAEQPQVLAGAGRVVRLWRAFDRDEGWWRVVSQDSDDGGRTWSAPVSIADMVMHAANPGAALDPDTGVVTAIYSDQADGHTDDITGFNLLTGDIDGWDWTALPFAEVTADWQLHMPSAMSSLTLGGSWFGALATVEDAQYVEDNENREIFLARRLADEDAVTFHRVTSDEDVSYWPALGIDRSLGWPVLHAAWASLDRASDGSESWTIETAFSPDLGDSWSQPIPLDTTLWPPKDQAWRPSLVATDDGLRIAWVEVEGEVHRLMLAELGIGGPGEPLAVAEATAPIEGISLAALPDQDGVLVAWHEAWSMDESRLGLARVDLGLGVVETLDLGL
ncbi:MAG: hypothetical protein H6742_08825 [Alphaproteobacteria bacterium]|nr:hypothetical protein [Alphaproteobacteria bacterium]